MVPSHSNRRSLKHQSPEHRGSAELEPTSDIPASPTMAQNIFVNKVPKIKTNAILFTGFCWVITSLSLQS